MATWLFRVLAAWVFASTLVITAHQPVVNTSQVPCYDPAPAVTTQAP